MSSALVVPFSAAGGGRGALAFYAGPADAFTLDDARVATIAAAALSRAFRARALVFVQNPGSLMAIHSIAPASSRRVPHGPVDASSAFVTELAAVTTLEGLRDAVAGPLRPLLPSRDISVLRAAHGTWEAAVGPEDGPSGIHQCPLDAVAAEGTVGMLGVGAPAQPAQARPVRGVRDEDAGDVGAEPDRDRDLRRLCARDGLTGCYTRTHAMEPLEASLRRASRTGLQVSVLMIDLDGFKAINDRYGHVPGDAVL